MEIITLSLGRNILKEGSRENLRMHSYSRYVGGLHVIVLTRKEHAYATPVHSGNLHVYPTNSRSRAMMLFDAVRIGWDISRNKRKEPTIISAQDPLEIGWAAAFLAFLTRAQLHLQVHGDYFSRGWASGSLLRSFRRSLGLFLLKRAPAVRVASLRIKDSLVARGVMESRITVLPIRPELEAFLATQKIERNDSRIRFLYMGRLAPEKDIERIIGAFAIVSAHRGDTFLEIVGEGEETSKIEDQIRGLELTGKVEMSPWTEKAAEKIASADVFLLASKHEAYALTLVEALAVGIPVITTDVGCVGEVVKDGVHGIVVREDSVNAYADAMKKMVEDEAFRSQCGTQGKQMVQELALHKTEEEYARAWVTSVSAAQGDV